MTLDLSDYVCYGAIDARRRNSVRGWIGLAGMRDQLRLELSGNCEADLAGKRIWFRVHKLGEADFDEKSVRNFQLRQIGITGKVTAAFHTPFGLDGQPIEPDSAGADTEWRPCLHIEWFGQHGRTLVEVKDVVMQEATDSMEEEDAFYGELFDDEGIEPPPEPEPMMLQPPAPVECEDPFGLDCASEFPFDSIPGKDYLQELKMLDDIIANPGERIPLREALADEIDFVSPDELDENQARLSSDN